MNESDRLLLLGLVWSVTMIACVLFLGFNLWATYWMNRWSDLWDEEFDKLHQLYRVTGDPSFFKEAEQILARARATLDTKGRLQRTLVMRAWVQESTIQSGEE